MNAVTRWKTIAIVAVAFSAGNIFATACKDAGGGKARAQNGGGGDGGGTPPPDLDSVEADIDNIKCVLRWIATDANIYGAVDPNDVAAANSACGV